MEPGRRMLAGRYELLHLLATGGMGQVWRARDTLLNRSVAIKVLRSEFTGDATFLARFRAEAQHNAVLAHRNIAALYDYGETPAGVAGPEHLAYLVMELVQGDSLSDVLAAEPRPGVERTLDVLRQTAAGLAVAHAAGVVHRDVKPGNVLVGDDGVVKITDFGIAWSSSSVPLTKTGQVVGTAHYFSPEQAAGGKATPASDVYALGLIGYECLAGHRAFDGENSVQIALMQLRDPPEPLPEDVPENVRRLIARALLKDPAGRFPDGAAFRDAVDDVLAGRTLPAPPIDVGTRAFPVAGWPSAPARRRRRLVAPLVALLAGAGIAVGAVQLAGQPAPPVPAAADTGPTSVRLAAADYVGRPVDDVEAALAALGLEVERVPVETPEVGAGLVTGISPAGAVPEGERITVSYAVAPAAAPVPPAPPAEDTPAPPAQVGVPAPDVPVAGDAGGATDAAEGAGNGSGNGNAGGNGKGNGNGNAGGNGNGNGNGRGRS